MNFKLDENLPDSLRDLLNDAGHDAVTVADQGIEGSADGVIASICRKEARAIMTMDLDFADIRAYPPHLYSGILVFRLADQDQRNLLAVGVELIPKLSDHALAGKLWIVEESRIRIRG